MPRTIVPASIAVLLLAAAGSCAKPADEAQVLTGDVTIAALRAAPDAAAKAGSGHFEMRVRVDAPTGPVDVVATGGFADHRMTMQMDLGSVLAQAAEASGGTVPTGFDAPMQIVADGNAVYLRMPMLQALTGQAGWLSLTQADVASAGGSLGLGAGAVDPSQLLETLRGAAGAIEQVGTDQVRGVTTTHVRTTVEIDKALARMPAAQRASLKDQLGRLDAPRQGLPVEVWIDRDGLVRRISVAIDDVNQTSTAGGKATMRIDFFDYGEPVDIVVPAASDTTPFSDVLGAFAGAH
jgi:hypothetical protein